MLEFIVSGRIPFTNIDLSFNGILLFIFAAIIGAYFIAGKLRDFKRSKFGQYAFRVQTQLLKQVSFLIGKYTKLVLVELGKPLAKFGKTAFVAARNKRVRTKFLPR